MNQPGDIPEWVEAVRQKTLMTLKALTNKAKDFELPEPPGTLEQYRRKLEDNTYQVLVVGEAKRGKSTFVNALIGRDILPTDVDIATSQVFRSALRSAKLIVSGSRTIRSRRSPPPTCRVMALRWWRKARACRGWTRSSAGSRWMCRPDSCPPTSASWTRPALGPSTPLTPRSRTVSCRTPTPSSSSCDSQAPIGEPEIQFVEEILEVTRSIFFIQTKIDQFRQEAWQEIQKRNQEILREPIQGTVWRTRGSGRSPASICARPPRQAMMTT